MCARARIISNGINISMALNILCSSHYFNNPLISQITVSMSEGATTGSARVQITYRLDTFPSRND